MGECGCASTSPEVRLTGPDGIQYGIEIYPGCSYCHTPVGVVVYRFDKDESELWLEGVAEAEFSAYQGVNGEWVRPVIDPSALAAEWAEWSEGDDALDEQTIRQVLPGAVWRTADDWHRLLVPLPDKGTTDE